MAEKRASSESREQSARSRHRRQVEAAGPEDAVDQTIASIEALYLTLTGSPPPAASERPYAPIPVERSPEQYVAGQLDRLSLALGSGAATAGGASWSPPAAVWEDDRELVVCLDLPGVGPESVEVAVDGSLLSVSGNRPAHHNGHRRLRLREGPHGPFERRFALPPRVASAETRALMTDGILEVHLTKSQEGMPGPRRVPIT